MPNKSETTKALATRLRIAREQAGLSQGQVAAMLELHRPSVSEMEAGRRRVSVEELVQLADIYGVDINWLTGHEDETTDEYRAKVELAARGLAKMRPEDIDHILDLLKSLQKYNAE